MICVAFLADGMKDLELCFHFVFVHAYVSCFLVES